MLPPGFRSGLMLRRSNFYPRWHCWVITRRSLHSLTTTTDMYLRIFMLNSFMIGSRHPVWNIQRPFVKLVRTCCRCHLNFSCITVSAPRMFAIANLHLCALHPSKAAAALILILSSSNWWRFSAMWRSERASLRYRITDATMCVLLDRLFRCSKGPAVAIHTWISLLRWHRDFQIMKLLQKSWDLWKFVLQWCN